MRSTSVIALLLLAAALADRNVSGQDRPEDGTEPGDRSRKRSKRRPARGGGLSFRGKKAGVDVAFAVDLPEEYEGSTCDYPVIYALHGGLKKSAAQFQASHHIKHFYRKAVAEGTLAPCIIVYPDAFRDTAWADSHDGRKPAETAFIRDLIPYVETNYRAKKGRENRALIGFSLGGYGAMGKALKYPDLFCCAVLLDGIVPTWATLPDSLKTGIFNNDEKYFNRYSPYTSAVRNREAVLRSKVALRLVGSNVPNVAFRAHLVSLGIPHEYEWAPAIHSPKAILSAERESSLAFIGRHLAVRPPAGKRGRASTATARRGADEDPSRIWVRRRKLPAGVKRETFHSPSMKHDVSYAIYLPPHYEKSAKPLPVIYWLHPIGPGGAPRYFGLLKGAMASGKVRPCVLVFVNGTYASFYCDSYDGKCMVETSIVKELIPHIEKTYRVVDSRAGRLLCGFSMGGAGAIKLALKYPELFGSVVACAPVTVDLDVMMKLHADEFRKTFNGDSIANEHWLKNCPYRIAKQNRDAIVGNKVRIKMLAGSGDFAREWSDKYAKHLKSLKIPHEYETIEDVTGHREKEYCAYIVEGLRFHEDSMKANGL